MTEKYLLPCNGRRKGPAPRQRSGIDEGPVYKLYPQALTYPIAAQWAPFLSRYAGED